MDGLFGQNIEFFVFHITLIADFLKKKHHQHDGHRRHHHNSYWHPIDTVHNDSVKKKGDIDNEVDKV